MSLKIKQLFERFGFEQADDGAWVDKHEIIRGGLDLRADEAFVDRANEDRPSEYKNILSGSTEIIEWNQNLNLLNIILT